MRYTFTKRPPKVVAAASKDDTRPALCRVWFDADAGELRVTDSYIAARVPVSPDAGDTSGWLEPETLERSRKRDAGAIACNGSAIVYEAPYGDAEPDAEYIDRMARARYARPEGIDPPKLEQLWPVDRHGFTVGINAGFLKRLADALGAEDSVVELTFTDGPDGRPNPLRAILVRTKDHNENRGDGLRGVPAPEGLLMPVRVS